MAWNSCSGVVVPVGVVAQVATIGIVLAGAIAIAMFVVVLGVVVIAIYFVVVTVALVLLAVAMVLLLE